MPEALTELEADVLTPLRLVEFINRLAVSEKG